MGIVVCTLFIVAYVGEIACAATPRALNANSHRDTEEQRRRNVKNWNPAVRLFLISVF
jgi:hypothetical protein